ncbi:hypothetical protein GCM10028771_15650 [Nocardioides marmoraquaticus]
MLARADLYALGITRGEVRAQLRAARWQAIGSQSVALHNGPVTRKGWLWAAVVQGGPRAHLDGAAALEAAGLQRYTAERIRVSVPRGARIRRTRLFDVRQTRRWDPGALAPTGIPRTRPAVAAVRAALWAASDRQAALLLTMTVQQGLARAEDVATAALAVRRDRRRTLVHGVLLDLLGGVRSLPELDFARLARRHGLPTPSRQLVRRGPHGRVYLDVVWDDWGVVVEIDGIQHGWAESAVPDALRHNEVALGGETVLRLPVLGLRVAPDEFFEQVRRALTGAGCPLAA